jgi:hypothetical protein
MAFSGSLDYPARGSRRERGRLPARRRRSSLTIRLLGDNIHKVFFHPPISRAIFELEEGVTGTGVP